MTAPALPGIPGVVQRPGLRQTMDIIGSCIDPTNNFVGAADDDVSPESARSMALLMARVRCACDGLESQLSDRLASAPPRTPGAPSDDGPRALLSPRERQIAHLLVDGYTNVNVAAHFGVTTNTVRTLMRRLYRKLGVRNRADLVREVLRRPL